jgi:ubiquinone biosynthesis protein UbiJ
LQLAGDAQFAADVNWLAENLRWDVAADVERLFGPVSAERLRTWGLAVARALREAVARLSARGGA